ncbi:hypothetical protein KTT_48320 [Tengunoibacter tsumagoiensis]|uniref:Uncharacterized protein n=1 Tax=Tengunoibacter tsumagoiensis TaxID=2014871 RepID=A0A402A768_9CHLR|nr:hypothetical protein KTT_48320 [Tengunoibacter tsumagoiensis]
MQGPDPIKGCVPALCTSTSGWCSLNTQALNSDSTLSPIIYEANVTGAIRTYHMGPPARETGSYNIEKNSGIFSPA